MANAEKGPIGLKDIVSDDLRELIEKIAKKEGNGVTGMKILSQEVARYEYYLSQHNSSGMVINMEDKILKDMVSHS